MTMITADPMHEHDPVRDRLHDLRNLFGVVASGTHLLADAPAPERRAFLLDAMVGAAARGSEILSALLAGGSTGEVQACRLPERIAGLAPILATMVGKRRRLDLDLSAEPAAIACHPEQLDRIMLELVANASRAVREGGNIRIRVRHALGRIWIIVADDGAGMSRHRLAKIRSLAGPISSGAHGTGLRQVRSFAESLQGSCHIRSRLGRGTVIALALPAQAMDRNPDTGAK